MALLFMRLSPGKNHIRASKVALISSIVWAVVSIFLVALKCNLSHPWVEYSQKCANLVSILHSTKQKRFANMFAVCTMATHHCL